MKLVIEHGKTKREIEGSFNLMATRADLEKLIRIIKIQLALKEEENGYPFTHGWLQIPDVSIVQPSIINTPPKKWDED